jgi:rhamnosyltransferase
MPPQMISVVIPVKDGGDTLDPLLSQLFRQELACEFEVVIVDSGSRDDSLEIASRYPARLVEVPPTAFDHGLTRNLGIRESKGELVALLTQDAVPTGSGFLAALVQAFEDPAVGGVYGRQIPRDDADVVTRRNLESWLTGRDAPALSRLGDETWAELTPVQRYELCIFDNVCSALRRSLWEEVPFPATPFGEDIWWGREVVMRGWSIGFVPDAAVVHSHRRWVGEEFRRTRMCHAMLHDLFELATLPNLRHVPQVCVANLLNDLPYVWRHSPHGIERLRQLARVVGLAFASPVAQHLGIRDSRNDSRQDKRIRS